MQTKRPGSGTGRTPTTASISVFLVSCLLFLLYHSGFFFFTVFLFIHIVNIREARRAVLGFIKRQQNIL
jgi:hypothetical protein